MNWKSVSLNALRWRLLLLGVTAGLWGGVLRESALWLPGAVPTAPLLLGGLGLGLGLGALLAPAEALVLRYYRRAWRLALAGALLGAGLGLAAAAADLWLLDTLRRASPQAGWLRTLAVDAGLILTLGLAGGGSGIAAGLYPVRRARMWRGGLIGLVLGVLLGAAVIAVAALAAYDAWALLALLAGWGAVMALALHWWRRRRAARWLRLLTGSNAESVFPLEGTRMRLGKNQRNDVPLTDFQEVYPYHCEIRWVGDHYEIVDNEQGGVVLVNYRQVQEHALRPGDLIKIGTALLQYGEAL